MTVRLGRAMTPAGVLLIVCGCAGPIGTLRPGPSVPASQAVAADAGIQSTTEFDGSYRGRLRVIGSFGQGKDVSSWCESPGQPNVMVRNGQFSYAVPHPNVPGDATPVFPATIAPDGSFRGEIVAGTIAGLISGRHLEGTIDGSACRYAISADRL